MNEQATDQQQLPDPSDADSETVASPEEVRRAEEFLRDVAPHLGRLFGMELNIRPARSSIDPRTGQTRSERWSTNMQTGEVTADPTFFTERGYTPDMAVYATLHEVAAHLRELIEEPRHTEEVISFVGKDEAKHIFHNIFSDIAGNNLIHAVLPESMPKVAEELYRNKLFSETDYSHIQPRHMQFLYKIIRQEMIPDGETTVLPEVDEAIASLRDYEGKGDLIKYSTAVAKSRKEIMTPQEKFRVWKEIIYPVYQQLIEQDKQEPVTSGSGSGESAQASENPTEPQSSDEKIEIPGEGAFAEYYQDYRENRHPEPLSEEEHEEVHKHAKQKGSPSARPQTRQAQDVIDQQIRRETDGHTLAEQQRYNAEVRRWQSQIAEMRDVFKKVIQERIAQKRGLGRRALPEGAILDPNRLAQTVIDVKSGVEQPDAFRDYEQRQRQVEAVGKTDYVFVFDVSGSMADNGKAQAAASSAVIGLEGLAAMQRDIEDTQAANNIDLELDIRTAIYTFGQETTELKPLSSSLNLKERLDTYAAVSSPGDSNTYDFLALEAIQKLEHDRDRRQIALVVSDGESGDASRARRAIEQLRSGGWQIYGVSIGSEEAVQLYRPSAKRIDDPALLPQTIARFIEDTIS